MANSAMPIAVIGMSCRFPGDASNVENFWDLLVNRRSSVTKIPEDRFNVDSYYHPSSSREGGIKVKKGHFLKEDVSKFDAPFFSMTKGEADATDPQQRLLLEVAYEAFENAGLPMSRLAGSQTSVYSSCFVTDYTQISSYDGQYRSLHESTGHSSALVSNRVSWFFDLRGPSMTIDTGCSGSTVAFHLACESLRSGEATAALACGVNLILAPDPFIGMTAFNFVGPDGVSYSFDHRANGYSRGEGFAAILLKPLDAALRDGDTIRAVVRSSAVAQDGRTPGITLPNREAQAALIRHTYARAGLDFDQTAFFEAHGTGTVAGDAAELGAIGDVFASCRDLTQKMLVGSAKTNIGHLEGCAGLAGIIKAILAVERGFVPANLNFEEPRPENDLEKYRIKIPTQLTPWPRSGLRRASINCFGFGGTIAHLILDEPAVANELDHRARSGRLEENSTGSDVSALEIEPESSSKRCSNAIPTPDSKQGGRAAKRTRLNSADSDALGRSRYSKQLLVCSAPEQGAVTRNADGVIEYLARKSRAGTEHLKFEAIPNLAFTLVKRRTQFPWRTYAIADIEKAEIHVNSFSKPAQALEACKVVYVFSGQGAQWPQMGQELHAYQIYHQCLIEADEFLHSLGADWSVLDELAKNTEVSLIDEPEKSQALCTITQTALVDLLSLWNVKPAAVVGHSSGEIAAAYAAGAISRHDAWRLALYRGQACASAEQGAMLAIGLPADEVEDHIREAGVKSSLEIACFNSPSNTTISGDLDAIDVLHRALDQAKIFNRRLKVGVAYHHSRHMDQPARQYTSCINDVQTNSELSCAMVSSVTGGNIELQTLNGSYFVQNLQSPVRFATAITTALTASNPQIVLEIGPHAVLQSAIQESATARNLAIPEYASTLLRNKDAAQTCLEAVGKLWARGHPVDLVRVNEPSEMNNTKCLSDLPPYSWSHTRSYWFESERSKIERLRKHQRLDLLGTLDVGSNNIDMRWRNFVTPKQLPWVKEHRVQNVILYPAAGMIAMVLEAARQLVTDTGSVKGFELRGIKIDKAMVIPERGHGLETILAISPKRVDEGSEYNFSISSRTDENLWQRNCKGSLFICRDDCYRGVRSRPTFENGKQLSPKKLYQKMAALGMSWGPTFQNLVSAVQTNNGCSFQVKVPDTASVMLANFETPCLIHPATFDAFFHAIVFSALSTGTPKVPSAIDYVYVSNSLPNTPGDMFEGHSTFAESGLRSLRGDLLITTAEDPQLAVVIEGLFCTGIGSPGIEDETKSSLCTRSVWKEDIGLMTLEKIHQLEPAKIVELVNHRDPSNGIGIQDKTIIDKEVLLKTYGLGKEASNGSSSRHMLIIVRSESHSTFGGMLRALQSLLSAMFEVVLYSISEAANQVTADKYVLVALDSTPYGVMDWCKEDYCRLRGILLRSKRLLWLTRGATPGQGGRISPGAASILGVIRSLRFEDSNLRPHVLDLPINDAIATADNVAAIMEAIVANNKYDQEYEFAERNEVVLIPRTMPDEDMSQAVVDNAAVRTIPEQFTGGVRHLKAKIQTPGDFNSIIFTAHDEYARELGPDEVEIQVRANAIDGLDSLTVLGQTTKSELGSSCAGIVAKTGCNVQKLSTGDRVATFQPDSLRNVMRCSAGEVHIIPEGLSVTNAAAVVSDYVTAIHALCDVARLQAGETCLVANPTSGLGQAALQLGAHIGADIYAIVDSDVATAFLASHHFIDPAHILSLQDVASKSRTQRWDVVLSSDLDSTTSTLATYWRSMAELGRLVLVRNGVAQHTMDTTRLPPHESASLLTVNMDLLRRKKPSVIAKAMAEFFDLFHTGVIEVPVTTRFPYSDVGLAFQMVSNPENISCVVLEAEENDMVPVIASDDHSLSKHLHTDATYLIVGGLGGLGRSIATYLVEYGARHLIFLSRSSAEDEDSRNFLETLQRTGASTARAIACDITDKDQLRSTLSSLTSFPPIRGVIHAAMVLRDCLFENMSHSDFLAALKPKIQGTWNLHELLPKTMDFFVMLSSIAGTGGMRGQTNYAAGNAFQDSFAEYRRSLGLPAVAIDLTVVLGVGVVAENPELIEGLKQAGVLSIQEEEMHRLIKAAITGFSTGEARTPAQTIVGVASGGYLDRNDIQDSMWPNDNRFRHILRLGRDESASAAPGDAAIRLETALPAVRTLQEATSLVQEALVSKLAKAISVTSEDIDSARCVSDYGVDSLIAVELRNWIQRQARATVSVFDLMAPTPIRQLAATIAETSSLVKTSVKTANEP